MISVYLETSVISYLAAYPSSDLMVADHQKATHDWWLYHRRKYDLAISPIVEKEIGLGEEKMARKRIELIKGIRLLTVTAESIHLARTLVKKGPVPEKAEVYALHISLAAIHGIEYLLSWNCKHIANVFIQKALVKIIQANGYECPVICTPESMLELNQ